MTSETKKSKPSEQVQKLPMQNAVGNIDMKIEASLARQLINDGSPTKISSYTNCQTFC